MRQYLSALVGFFCAAFTACEAAPDGGNIRHLEDGLLELTGSVSALPTSLSDQFAVGAPNFACVFDSYEVQLVCGGPASPDVVRFGREGRGPGELGASGQLTSGPSGTVAFFDNYTQRISFFSSEGYAGGIPKQTSLLPAGELLADSSFTGHTFPGIGSLSLRIAQTAGAAATPRWEHRLQFDAGIIGGATAMMTGATRTTSGAFVARIEADGEQYLARYDGDARFAGVLELRRTSPVLPTEDDVNRHVAQFASIPGLRPTPEDIETYRNRPLGPMPRVSMRRIIQEDEHGRLWVLTTRRSADGTDIDVFDGISYVGTATLAGNVRGIQIAGDQFVALAEYSTAGSVIPLRRLDWYRVRQ